jgi:hypothetical protein|tara:strand:+ start:360 stop:542 length:183 start_codon:yes stop_codon:yes gene_type:complete
LLGIERTGKLEITARMMTRCSFMLAGLAVAAAFQATPASQPRRFRQGSTAQSDLQVKTAG